MQCGINMETKLPALKDETKVVMKLEKWSMVCGLEDENNNHEIVPMYFRLVLAVTAVISTGEAAPEGSQCTEIKSKPTIWLSRMESQVWHSQMSLDCLKKINSFDSMFNMWRVSPYSFMGGFRLGYLCCGPIVGNDVNVIPKLLNCSFRGINSLTLGKFSYLFETGDYVRLTLFSNGKQNGFTNNFGLMMMHPWTSSNISWKKLKSTSSIY